MFPAKSLLTPLAVWLFATACLAEEPSFPQPEKGVELLKDQYIVQFNGADDFKEAKNSILNGEEVEVVRYIDTRNIGVYKFSSKKAAAKWRDGAVGVKSFEAGENYGAYICLKRDGSKENKKGGGIALLETIADCASFII
jgi:hypothetical protein